MPSPATNLLPPEALERVSGLALNARRIVEGAMHGLHRSPQQGMSVEFAQHREYTPGDEIRHLDWRVIGRSDRYVVKQYEQETNLRAVLLVDASRSMAFSGRALEGEAKPAKTDGEPTPDDEPAHVPGGKYAYASRLAAALAYVLLGQSDSVGLMLASEEIDQHVEPSARPGQLLRLCHALERTEPAGGTRLQPVMHKLAARLKRRSLVVVLSDLFDNTADVLRALGQLHHRGHEVIVLHVLDPTELSLDLGMGGHGVTVIRDMETGQDFDAEPTLIRELYEQEVASFLEQIDAGAKAHGIDLVRCLTSDPAEQVISQYLNLRARAGRRGR